MRAHREQAVSGTDAHVALMLADDGDKRFDSAPSQVAIGAIRLGGWQITGVDSTPADFPGQDAYLMKLNYELALEPEVPGLRWFEIGIGFSVAEGGQVAVLDALPRNVVEPQGAAAFSLGRHLGFAPQPDGTVSHAQLPAVTPFVDVFSVGGPGVRWRYMSRDVRYVRPGSYVSWIVFVVPAGCDKLQVEVTGRYDLASDDALGYRPASHPAQCELSLPLASAPPPGSRSNLYRSVAGAVGSAAPTGEGTPRVFISYSHDDQRHVDSVLAFGEFLLRSGIDAHLDRWDLNFRRDWYQWATEQITSADFVVVVASPLCRLVGNGEIENTQRRGMQSELALLRELMHTDRATWLRRLLPVVLPGGKVSDIPLFLQPETADHYLVADFSVSGAEDLLRVITGQTSYPRPAIGMRVNLRPHR
jgi:SEFIR domain